MGIVKFAVGAGTGCLFLLILPDNSYRIFRSNLYKPISKEINKTEIDLAKVLRLSIEGVSGVAQDLWNS